MQLLRHRFVRIVKQGHTAKGNMPLIPGQMGAGVNDRARKIPMQHTMAVTGWDSFSLFQDELHTIVLSLVPQTGWVFYGSVQQELTITALDSAIYSWNMQRGDDFTFHIFFITYAELRRGLTCTFKLWVACFSVVIRAASYANAFCPSFSFAISLLLNSNCDLLHRSLILLELCWDLRPNGCC